MADKKATKAKTSKKSAKEVTFADIRANSHEELVNKVSELRVEIIALQRSTKTNEVQNVRAVGAKKRELARVLTALNLRAGEEK